MGNLKNKPGRQRNKDTFGFYVEDPLMDGWVLRNKLLSGVPRALGSFSVRIVGRVVQIRYEGLKSQTQD